NQLTIKKGIEKEYKVLVADSAAGAIKILESNKVDLILMDISIRGELNGLEFTKELKNADKYKHIPVIVVSAHASESDITNSVNAGSNDFLSKPFSMQELLEKIKKNLI
ncbi:MAG: response regulator, partial [Ignavibacteriaceae bacterium]